MQEKWKLKKSQMRYLQALKVVPVLCVFVATAVCNGQLDLSSKWKAIISLLLVFVAMIAVVIVKVKSPRNANTRRQMILLSACLVLSVVICLYFLYVKT